MNTNYLLPAEWERQSGVLLTWPHANTDWKPYLKDITTMFVDMARAIADRERLLIATPETDMVGTLLHAALSPQAMANVRIVECDSNDTWARDHAPITLTATDGQNLMLDFQFNGWGRKFGAEKDNAIGRNLHAANALHAPMENHLDFVLEGGAIESDGQGTILTTSQCLLAPHRNQPLTQADIEERLLSILHAQRVLWLDHGYLAGDDTDSHIDTLARFCSPQRIAYVQCTDPEDEHYEALRLMEEQLRSFRTLQEEPYELIPLPMAPKRYDEEGQRLPSTYANFLILNGAVLMPSYGDKQLDEAAQQQLQKAFPQHDIIAIDCQVLIQQHGSLHCCTMQFPVGVIK